MMQYYPAIIDKILLQQGESLDTKGTISHMTITHSSKSTWGHHHHNSSSYFIRTFMCEQGNPFPVRCYQPTENWPGFRDLDRGVACRETNQGTTGLRHSQIWTQRKGFTHIIFRLRPSSSTGSSYPEFGAWRNATNIASNQAFVKDNAFSGGW